MIKIKVYILLGFWFLLFLFLFLWYGPIECFREMLITTALTTKSHQYIANFFIQRNIFLE